MYQPRPSARDRAATIALVLAIHAALGFALINLSGNVREVLPEEVVEMFDVTVPPPPPRPAVVEKLPEPQKAEPKEDEGAASAKNIKSRATPVVAPKPPIVLPIPQPIPAAPKPNTGSDSTQGASTPGPGTGAGGQGTGTGSGGSGSGSGGGGSGGGTRPTVVQSTTLTMRDYPSEFRRSWPRGGRVFVAVRVQLDGRATDCKVNRSIGDPSIDAQTCRLVETRVRFRPAVDGNGRPYVTWYGYIQADVGSR